jgi:LysR family glycine cleavage system transcriptional activator
MAVRQGPTPSDPGVEAMLLAPLNLCAVASPSLASQIGPQSEVAALMAHPLIQDGHHHWEKLMANASLPNRPRVLHFNQTALAMDAAANGQGIALVPRLYLQGIGDKLVQLWPSTGSKTPCFVPPGFANPDFEAHGFHILWSRGQTLSPAAILLRDWLLAQVEMPTPT